MSEFRPILLNQCYYGDQVKENGMVAHVTATGQKNNSY